MFQDDLVTDSSRDPMAGSSPEDQARLDAAMRRADELLVTSLKSDERRRNRRRILFLTLGGVAMLAILCALLVAFTAETEQAGRLVQEGGNLFNQQKFAEACEKYQQAVKLDPKNVIAWNGLGWSQFNTGNYSDAEDSFKKVLKVAPKYAAALNGLGQLYLLQRKYDEAEKYLLKAAPEATAAWYGLARLYLLEGKWDDAAKWAKKIVASGDADEGAKQMLKAAQEKKLPDELRKQIEPATTAATSTVGNVQGAWQMMNQGRREEAKTILDELMEKSPKDAAALNAMGWYYLLASDFDQAKPYFEKCLEIEPLSAGALNGLARILKANDDLDGAIKLWQKMVDKLPGPNAGTFGLADAYMEKEEYAKAIPLLEQLLKEKPDDHALKDKLRHAREMASKKGAVDTENSEELSLQGWKQFQSRHYRDAITKFNEAIEANPDNCYAWNGLGWSHLNRGNKGAAEEALKKAISLQPNFPGAQTGLGQIYLEQRKYDLAQKYFEQAAESPGATTAFRGLTLLNLLAGRFEEAEKWAQSLIDAGGPDADASARAMLKAAQEKKLSEGLRKQLEPPRRIDVDLD